MMLNTTFRQMQVTIYQPKVSLAPNSNHSVKLSSGYAATSTVTSFTVSMKLAKFDLYGLRRRSHEMITIVLTICSMIWLKEKVGKRVRIRSIEYRRRKKTT